MLTNKRITIPFVLFLGFSVHFSLYGQSNRIAQFVYSGLHSRDVYAEIKQAVSELPEIKLLRLDQQNRNGYIEFNTDMTIQEEELRTILSSFSVALHCYFIREKTPGSFTLLDPKTCETGALPALK